MATSTSSASHGINSTPNLHPSSDSKLADMDELNPSRKSIDDAGTSALMSDISIPIPSPIITSDHHPCRPSALNSPALPTTTTTTTLPPPAKSTATQEMTDPSHQNQRLENEASTSQERLTAAPTITNEESSSTDSAPPPPPTTTTIMSKSEGKAPATANSAGSNTLGSQESRPRLDSDAIGPSAVSHSLPAPSTVDAGPSLNITLLLTSGARHPYKIDEKYLTKRAVAVPGVTENGKKDPLSISVYTLKELILREWREEWEAKPSSPSSIRLIFFGRLLDDKSALRECKFKFDTSNVVHMTVRPQDVVDEEDASKAKSMGRGSRDDGERTVACRCVIL
ncbi:hypothetical protein DSL72_004707 [Monilinia vaccinii-corymbosi]|uniref:Ubiquitin-like domain-containing protein n=1 Tax=Monilinia vaccinii-corymbosi TaxID=61207 RepID=A0A8A3P9Z4_9HELO|nr:hypothetical protein DSL72_004707 [Monilinia vaccinii-corymbosi]